MRSVRLVLASGLFCLIPAMASPAWAHETRQVGDYELVVGWWQEPAFAGQPNGPEVTVTKGGDPVNEGVELEVELVFGSETMTYPLEAAFVVGVFGDEGNYNANLVPTRPGTYTYRLTGTIEGNQIEEEFTSGPETFGDIEDPAELAFPAVDPSQAELASRLERETQRLNEEVDAASSARTFGFVGMGVGLLALVLAALALARARRPSP
ncbi:MAG TPA: hypothetical protein VEA19_03850 [Actinomycetota bacterium]|nr:hypothetical protein [Actinomycetota bacterium]